jgi:hypothetical protein
MSHTSRERRHVPVPMRWPHTGSDPSRPRHCARRTMRSLIRSERLPRCPLHASNLANVQIRRPHPVGVTSTIELCAAIKSPWRPLPRQCPTSRDFVPWRFLDAGRHTAWKGSSCRHPKTCTENRKWVSPRENHRQAVRQEGPIVIHTASAALLSPGAFHPSIIKTSWPAGVSGVGSCTGSRSSAGARAIDVAPATKVLRSIIIPLPFQISQSMPLQCR